MITSEIVVEVAVNQVWIVDLSGDDVLVPGVQFDLIDTSPSPGCVKMRIGKTTIDLMEQSYFVNGEEHSWKKQ